MGHRSAIPTQAATAWTPPAGLAGWWYGSSTTGGLWTDRSGNGRHLTIAGNATVGANGLTIPNRDGYATIAAPGWATIRTVCLWAYITEFQSLDTILGGEGANVGIDMRTGPKWRATGVDLDAGANFTLGAWAFVAARQVTTPSNVLSLWTGATKSTSAGLWVSACNNIGRLNSTYPRDPKGSITGVMAFTASLTDEQVADIYANSTGRPA